MQRPSRVGTEVEKKKRTKNIIIGSSIAGGVGVFFIVLILLATVPSAETGAPIINTGYDAIPAPGLSWRTVQFSPDFTVLPEDGSFVDIIDTPGEWAKVPNDATFHDEYFRSYRNSFNQTFLKMDRSIASGYYTLNKWLLGDPTIASNSFRYFKVSCIMEFGAGLYYSDCVRAIVFTSYNSSFAGNVLQKIGAIAVRGTNTLYTSNPEFSGAVDIASAVKGTVALGYIPLSTKIQFSMEYDGNNYKVFYKYLDDDQAYGIVLPSATPNMLLHGMAIIYSGTTAPFSIYNLAIQIAA